MSSSSRPGNSPLSAFDILAQALLNEGTSSPPPAYETSDDDDDSPTVHRWLYYNPFITAGETQQEDPGLQVAAFPRNSEDTLDLAIAILDNNPNHRAFKFKEELSQAAQTKLVIFLCELAIKQSSAQIEEKMRELDLTLDAERMQRFEETFAKSLTAESSYHQYKNPTAQERLLIAEKIKRFKEKFGQTLTVVLPDRKDKVPTEQECLQIKERVQKTLHTAELDSQIDQIKTKTRRPPFPFTRDLNSPITLFKAPESPSQRKMEWKKMDDTLLGNADLYLKAALGSQTNHIRTIGNESSSRLIQLPQTARDFFELAYAIADRNVLYKGSPVTLEWSPANAWDNKQKKWFLVLNFLDQIPADSDCFRNHADQIGALRLQTQLLREMSFEYSNQYQQDQLLREQFRNDPDHFPQGELISLEQIQRANAAQEALLKCFETLNQALPMLQERTTG